VILTNFRFHIFRLEKCKQKSVNAPKSEELQIEIHLVMFELYFKYIILN
jgi:hypothetical protein